MSGTPNFQKLQGLCQRIGQPDIQHFPTNITVEPLNKGILVRLAIDNKTPHKKTMSLNFTFRNFKD